MLLAAALGGCGDATDANTPDLLGPVDEVGGDRPAAVFYPDDYTADDMYPLVVMLHGFRANAQIQDIIFGLKDRVTARQFVLVTPEGTPNPDGDQFWNATNECCDFFNQNPDDVRYISDLIAATRSHFHIDPTRIVLVGHSNGGYMANRYACDQRAGVQARVTRIVNVAGLSFVDGDACQAAQPVEVLHIHGTADMRVPFESNVTDPSLSNPNVVEDDDRLRAGAFELAERWAERAGCDPAPSVTPAALDLSSAVDGFETDALEWRNCAGGSSTLLRANGVGHLWFDGNERMQQIITNFAIQSTDTTY